ncbi:MAG: response regulator, partial [Candidatus Parcubacteria bacterium]|nr:response regulator [Candidatus Parcubacteria bacterium]
LLDIMMPKMNGIEMLKAVKADPALKDIPIVILTNLGDRPEDIQKCKDLGAEDYWVKANISLKEITEKVNKILEGKNGK